MTTKTLATTGTNKSPLPSLKTLISFEEIMSRYYEVFGSWEKSHREFWKSASLAKQTRANLYTNMQEDFTKNAAEYELRRAVTGPAMSLLNKVNNEAQRAGRSEGSLENHLDFIRRVETIIFEQATLPVIIGKTTNFRKISTILSQIQSNQLRLIDGYIKLLKARPAPVDPRRRLVSSASN